MKNCIILATCALLVTAVGLQVEADSAPAPTKSGIILTHFDKDVRPADDLYRHVNGKWLAEGEIPADKSSYGVINELFDENVEQLRVIAEEIFAMEDLEKGSDEQKIRDLYLSYTDLEKREQLGMKPIEDDLKQVAAIETTEQILQSIVDLGVRGVQGPLGFFIHQDGKNATEYISYFTQAGLGLPDRDYYIQEEDRFKAIRAEYKSLIEKQWLNAGLKNAEMSAATVLKLETKIAESHWSRVDNRDREKTYNKLSPDDLAELAPALDWDLLLEDLGVASESEFIVRQPDFLTAFGTLLKTSSIDDWKTYLTWKILDTNASTLTVAMDEANFEFYSGVLRGVQEQQPMWKRGIQTVNGVLGEAIGKVYIERHFPPQAKHRMDQLVKNLIQAYDESLTELEWMTDETRMAAREKLKKVTPKIGYPTKWKDYSTLDINPDTLQANIENASIWNHNEMMAKLGQPIDREEWGLPPQTINAYYSPTMNEIVFPAGILQPPMFNLEADDAVNYGAIGMIIGHELGHAFDDQGSRSDGDGNLNNWWTDEDREEFEKRTAMLIDQYSSFRPFEDLSVNGELTLGENIGDLGGTTIAFRAYMISLNGKEAPVLDGFTGPQRFFIGGAQLSRNMKREAALRQQIMTDPHSPKEYRVNGVVANMPEFYSAFDVTEEDGLFRPANERVKIW